MTHRFTRRLCRATILCALIVVGGGRHAWAEAEEVERLLGLLANGPEGAQLQAAERLFQLDGAARALPRLNILRRPKKQG